MTEAEDRALQERVDPDDLDAFCTAYRRDALARCYRTDPCERPAAEAAVLALCDIADIPATDVARSFSWVSSPPLGAHPAYWLSSELDRSWATRRCTNLPKRKRARCARAAASSKPGSRN